MSDRDIEIKVLQAEYEKACIAERANRFKKKVIEQRLRELKAQREREKPRELSFLMLEAFGGII